MEIKIPDLKAPYEQYKEEVFTYEKHMGWTFDKEYENIIQFYWIDEKGCKWITRWYREKL